MRRDMRGLLAWLRSHWRALRSPARVDADMHDEMRFHIEMDAQRRMTQGVDADEARRQAAMAFGGIEPWRGASRDALGFTWARGLSIDLKLGTRMLAKYPGLTIVAVFALSLAIGAGAGYLEFVNDLMHGQLPFEEGHRIVGIQNWDQQTGKPEHRSTADFVAWRGTLKSFEAVAASRPLERNLTTGDGRVEPVRGVEMSAAAFRIARVPALLGRTLTADDERPGATPVAVLGHDVWMARFGGEPSAIGRTVRLGNDTYTVVGVMPEGFGLPVSHNLWVPLALNAANYARRDGAPLRIFGRLARGVELNTAQAELTALALRNAAEFPDTDRHIRPIVKPYVRSLWSALEDSKMQTVVFYSANVLFLGLLLLCGANVATLVFARTVSRDAEISIRTALGASRARIAGQFFAEALVLCAIAMACGLTFASFALRWVKDTVTQAQGRPIMFWWNDDLSFVTLVYASILSIVAALIVGVTPALKATGRRVQERLRHASGASSASLKFGGVWTAVIVMQVAVTVLFVSVVGILGWAAYVGGERPRHFPDAEFVGMRLLLERPAANTSGDATAAVADAAATATAAAEHNRRVRAVYHELARRLDAEPGVAGVTYAGRLPGTNQLETRVEVDDGARRADDAPRAAESGSRSSGSSGSGSSSSGLEAVDPDGKGRRVRTAQVGVDFVETFQAPIVAGRAFTEADLAQGRHVAIVDQTFVRLLLGGQHAIGRRVRDAERKGVSAGPWIEIIGVIRDLTDDTNKPPGDSVMYRPAPPEAIPTLHVAVHTKGNPSAMMSRIRIIANEVEPTLRLIEMQTLDQVGEQDQLALDFFARLLGGISAVALLLATAGVYALMSFTVARRTSEIGIRLALGASTGRIVLSTFSRALAQIGLGLLIGSIPALMLLRNLGPEVMPIAGNDTAMMACAAATCFVAAVTTLACVMPARRALLVQPTDALKVR
jgi:putative ABC transport system permease protein